MKRLLLLLTLTALASPASAQAPAAPPSGTLQTVEVDPIRCWWRTSTGAARLGEHFDLTLTCAVLESETVIVVPDETHLGASVIAMAPFEVVSGTPKIELHSGVRRFFQYQYTLRMINPDAIGRDISIPDMVLHYKVNNRVSGTASVQGRDLLYVLPVLRVHIQSMVPSDADDIRDSNGESFATAESLSLRAGALEIVSITAVVLGVLMTIFVLIRLVRGGRGRTPADQRRLSTFSVVRAAIGELSAVRSERERQGWTEALAGRALSATRVAAACALGRPVSQQLAARGATEGNGQVLAATPLLLPRRKARMLSSPVTAEDLSRYASKHPTADPGMLQMMDSLRDALAAFSSTQYQREVALDESALDSALSSASSAAGLVKAEHSWIKTAFRQLVGGTAAEPSQA